MNNVDIITIDGPASSGKGTVAKIIAKMLNFHYLDSGAIYRAIALLINENKNAKVVDLINNMELNFIDGKVLLNNKDITKDLRIEAIGMLASDLAKDPNIRLSILSFQRLYARFPGLVTDGRDMGSIVFPNATLKIFLTADAKVRAQRRYKELHNNFSSVTIAAIQKDIEVRDKQDKERTVAPLVFNNSYKFLDNSSLTIDDTVKLILNWFKEIK